MDLYRGMSNLEMDEWNGAQRIPRDTNFTTHPLEAIRLGEQYLFDGRLIIARLAYDDMLFEKIIEGGNPSFDGDWYRNAYPIDLGAIIMDVHFPEEIIILADKLCHFIRQE